jgi:acyl-CoA synthetase (AMP-forming)/AMP-acid ligase II
MFMVGRATGISFRPECDGRQLRLQRQLFQKADVQRSLNRSSKLTRKAAVIGIADARWGERPVVFVTAAPAHVADPAKLSDHLARQAATSAISRFAIPSTIHVVASLPKTSVGKIDKKALRSFAATGGGSSEAPSRPCSSADRTG